jgi:hypothetical protein
MFYFYFTEECSHRTLLTINICYQQSMHPCWICMDSNTSGYSQHGHVVSLVCFILDTQHEGKENIIIQSNTTKRMSNTDPTHVLAKGKQFLYLIRHQPCYSPLCTIKQKNTYKIWALLHTTVVKTNPTSWQWGLII